MGVHDAAQDVAHDAVPDDVDSCNTPCDDRYSMFLIPLWHVKSPLRCGKV